MLVAGRGFPREGDQSPSAPPDPAQSPPTAGQAPPKTTPHLVQPWLPGTPFPASGRRGRVLSERPKKEKKGRLGDSYVTGRGFTTFSFAIDNIAKCMKETALPGREREGEGKVSSSPAGFAWRSGRAPTPEWRSRGLGPSARPEGSREAGAVWTRSGAEAPRRRCGRGILLGASPVTRGPLRRCRRAQTRQPRRPRSPEGVQTDP